MRNPNYVPFVSNKKLSLCRFYWTLRHHCILPKKTLLKEKIITHKEFWIDYQLTWKVSKKRFPTDTELPLKVTERKTFVRYGMKQTFEQF